MSNEFSIIQQYFATQLEKRADVIVGIGDDAAIVKPPVGQTLAVTTDTLVAGIHFPEQTLPHDLGYKALAVNLSDLAAMGATPAWVLLAITLPKADVAWIESFCEGFFTLANRYSVQLIGGDLTHGPLSMTVQALGFVPPGQALLRSQAKAGDLIYVTGTLGDAGLGLALAQKKIAVAEPYQRYVLERLHRPEPRMMTGEKLLGLAHAAIDISDGLAADLQHILDESHVGARVYIDRLPLSEALTQTLSEEKAIALALTAGDDYELCFTVPHDKQSAVEAQLATLPCRYTCIGEVVSELGLTLCDKNGNQYHGPIEGYQHF